MRTSVDPSAAEVRTRLPGDDVVPHADVVMDRAFTLDAPPAEVWPWIVQLGKRRGGWYLPRRIERIVPVPRRATREVDARWQGLDVGDVVPDYGGRHETFTVDDIDPGRHLVYRARRGTVDLSWALVLTPAGEQATRVHLRLRLAPVRHRRLAEVVGGAFDLLTIAGMASGLRERLADLRGRS